MRIYPRTWHVVSSARLAELVELAIEGLHKALKSKDLPAIVRASQIVLDRCDFSSVTSI